ncbi:MAG: hypothetical protein D6717_12945 [Gammaproteobacteria bacterium]|nr:MAG: hypothetical protein D6717_12945 [Gammaproteobacteria bacterium]
MKRLHRMGGLLALLLLPMAASAADEALPDPMQPPRIEVAAPAAKARAPRWYLSSVLVSPGRRVAIINGRAVAPGERVDGARVVAIHPERVILETRGRRIELRLPALKLKKASR